MGIFDFFKKKRKCQGCEKRLSAGQSRCCDSCQRNKNCPPQVIPDLLPGQSYGKMMINKAPGTYKFKASQEILLAPLTEYLTGRPNINRIYSRFTHSIRNGFTVKRFLNEANWTSDEIKFLVSGSFSDIANILQGILDKYENIEVLGVDEYSSIDELDEYGEMLLRKAPLFLELVALKEAIEILGGTSDSQNTWIVLINNRVNSMPLNSDATEMTFGGGVDDLANMHFEEYKLGESEVPENKREKVALDRIEGLLSVKDVIENYYSKEHRFHFNASIKGALLYASSLGLNVDQYEL
jgi:hypothetical protein